MIPSKICKADIVIEKDRNEYTFINSVIIPIYDTLYMDQRYFYIEERIIVNVFRAPVNSTFHF